ALTLPVFALEMGGHLAPLLSLDRQRSNWIELFLATPVVLWAGRPFFQRGFFSLKTGKLNMFTLIAMAIGVAWIYSIVAILAMESAGVTLLKGDLGGIVRARHLAAATMGDIRQNLFFAFIYNAAGVPVAGGVLYPFLGILLSPIIAAAAMALSSFSV